MNNLIELSNQSSNNIFIVLKDGTKLADFVSILVTTKDNVYTIKRSRFVEEASHTISREREGNFPAYKNYSSVEKFEQALKRLEKKALKFRVI